MHPAKGDYQPPELFLRNVVIFRKYQAGRLFYAAPLGGGSDAIRFASWIPTASSTRPATTAADCSGRLRSKLHEDLSAGEYWVVVDRYSNLGEYQACMGEYQACMVEPLADVEQP